MEYVAIDFETANIYPDSACSLGLVRFDEEGKALESSYHLICPPYKAFDPLCVSIHHLTYDAVKDEPPFSESWDSVRSFIGESPLIAHNAQFDMKVLESTLGFYGIDIPPLRYYCTLSLARKLWKRKSYALVSLSADFGWSYEAHNALADADAAGRLFSRLCGEYLYDEEMLARFMKRIYKKSRNPFPRVLGK